MVLERELHATLKAMMEAIDTGQTGSIATHVQQIDELGQAPSVAPPPGADEGEVLIAPGDAPETELEIEPRAGLSVEGGRMQDQAVSQLGFCSGIATIECFCPQQGRIGIGAPLDPSRPGGRAAEGDGDLVLEG